MYIYPPNQGMFLYRLFHHNPHNNIHTLPTNSTTMTNSMRTSYSNYCSMMKTNSMRTNYSNYCSMTRMNSMRTSYSNCYSTMKMNSMVLLTMMNSMVLLTMMNSNDTSAYQYTAPDN